MESPLLHVIANGMILGHVTGQVVQIWTSEILQIPMVFNDDLHGDSEIIYNILNNASMTSKQYNEVHNFAVQQQHGNCPTMNRYTTNMLNIACLYAHSMT